MARTTHSRNGYSNNIPLSTLSITSGTFVGSFLLVSLFESEELALCDLERVYISKLERIFLRFHRDNFKMAEVLKIEAPGLVERLDNNSKR